MEEIKQNTNESVRGSSKSTDFGNHSTKLRLRKGKVMQNFTPGMRGSIESTDLGNHSSLSQGSPIISIEAWVAKQDKFRVVGAGYSRPFPFIEQICDAQFAEIYRKNVQESVKPSLEKHQIQYESISLRRRYARNGSGLRNENLHTLLIHARGENTNIWRAAAEELQGVFQRNMIGSDLIEVEICNVSRLRYQISSVLPDDVELLDAITNLKAAMMETVMSLCSQEWTSVAFHGRRPKQDSSALASPTVLVFFRRGALLDFDSVRSSLLKVISSSVIPLRLELLQGSIDSTAGTNTGGKVLHNLTNKPQNGSSIGLEGNDKEAGSLGGWLIFDRDSSRRKVAITCNHIAASNLTAGKFKTGEGVGGGKWISEQTSGLHGPDWTEEISVEYPAALDRNASKQFFRSNQQSPNPVPRIKNDLETLDWLSSNAIIGRVIVKSGVRLNGSTNHRMDWALIETPNSYSTNKSPPRTAFQHAEQFPEGISELYNPREDLEVRTMGVMQKGSWVTKRGRTSDVTSGYVNRMARQVRWEQHGGMMSEELEVIGLTQNFAEGGDSGSMVMNAAGELVGLLFARDSCASEWDMGFVTPIQDIQQDVRDLTGGELVLG